MIVYGRKNPMKHPEDYLQKSVIKAIAVMAPKVFVAHVPNGGKRNKLEAIRLKAAGVKRGVPDLLLILSSGEVAFVEIKAERGKLSDDQKAFRDLCYGRNTKWAMLQDLDQVKILLEGWGEIPYRAPPIDEVAA